MREHLIEIGLWSDTNCDVRVELFAGCYRGEIGYVVDKSLLDVAPAVGADERGGGPGLLCERRNSVQQFGLQPEQIFCRLDDDAGNAEGGRRNVVVLERALSRSLGLAAFSAAD